MIPDPESLKIPIFVAIQFTVDHSPTHGFLDDVEVVGYLYPRHRIFEKVLTIVSICPILIVCLYPHKKVDKHTL